VAPVAVERAGTSARTGDAAPGPVMLLTFDAPFHPEAARFALDSAAEAGALLVICNGVPLAAHPASSGIRTFGDPAAVESMESVARQAAERGIAHEQALYHHPRPVAAALDVVRRQHIALLVFGCDRRGMGRWRYSRAVRKLRRDAPCLIWLPD
jgi:nucleotide-binding universal stress UspA family protein